MKLQISRKAQYLFITLTGLLGVILTIIYFFMYTETDRYKTFIRDLWFFLFLFYTLLYGRRYLIATSPLLVFVNFTKPIATNRERRRLVSDQR